MFFLHTKHDGILCYSVSNLLAKVFDIQALSMKDCNLALSTPGHTICMMPTHYLSGKYTTKKCVLYY